MRETEQLENNAKEMFNKLRNHLNKEVTLEYISYGRLKTITGKLISVKDFISVQVENKGVPFVGYGCAIFVIYSKDREVLYLNSGLGFDYDKTDIEGVEREKRKIFGDRIVDEEKRKVEQAKAEGEEYLKKSTILAKKNKLILQKEGLTLVKEEKVKEWLEFTENKGEDGYYYWIIKGTVEMMKKMEAGVPYADAINEVFKEDLKLSPFQEGTVAKCLVKFSKQGEEFRRFWNEYCGLKDIGGTAILHLGK